MADIFTKYLEVASSPVRWNDGGHVHNWRTHVPSEVREAWPTLSVEARCAVIACCEYSADLEVWD